MAVQQQGGGAGTPTAPVNVKWTMVGHAIELQHVQPGTTVGEFLAKIEQVGKEVELDGRVVGPDHVITRDCNLVVKKTLTAGTIAD